MLIAFVFSGFRSTFAGGGFFFLFSCGCFIGIKSFPFSLKHAVTFIGFILFFFYLFETFILMMSFRCMYLFAVVFMGTSNSGFFMAVILEQCFKFLDGIAEEIILGQDGTLFFPTFLSHFMFTISPFPLIFIHSIFLLFFKKDL